MTTPPRIPMALGKLSWTELVERQDQIEMVLIPIGSTEQHGPNLGLGQDHLITDAFCERAAECLYPRLVSLPAIPWGISDHHMNFPGSMTLRPETFLALLEDLIGSMRHHGFRRFLIVNGHGGNRGLMSVAVQDLGFRLDVDFLASVSHYTLGDPEVLKAVAGEIPTGHACEIEASHAYYLHPELIHDDALAPGDLDTEFRKLRDSLQALELEWPVAMNAVTRNGALGDARRGSREAGERMIESAIEDLGEILTHLRDSAPRWDGPPHRQVHVRPQVPGAARRGVRLG